MSKRLSEADGLLRSGQRELAALAYKQILEDSPEDSGALHRLGIIEFQCGRRQAALDLVARSLRVKADDPLVWSDFGLIHSALGHSAEALASHDNALALRPDVAEMHRQRGDLLKRLGRFGEALESYDQALALDPALSQALNNRGLALTALSRPLDALASYDRLLSLEPDHVLALCNRGQTLHQLGRLDEALASYDRALELQPDQLAVLNNRGVALQQLGRLEEALASFDRVLGLDPSHLEALNNRGNILRDLGRPHEALASLDRILAINPRFALAHNNRGNLLRDLDRLEDALVSYEAALAVDPQLAAAHANRGFVLWRLKRPGEALACHDQALRLDPRQAGAWNIRGLVLVSLDRPEDALASYDQALAVAPEFADALGNKGMLLMELGRLQEARQALERAVALSPRSARAYYLLTLCGRMSRSDPCFGALQALAREIDGFSVDGQIHLRFALAKAFHDVGEPAAAADQLAAGAKLKREIVSYDEAATLAEMDHIRTAFSARRMAEPGACGNPSDVPVFIIGMPRSGSTLIEQILTGHPEVFPTGEADHLTRALESHGRDSGAILRSHEALAALEPRRLQELGDAYVRQITLAAAPTARRVTSKCLDYFRYAGLLHLALPKAKIVHVLRDPIDTCLSCYSKLFGEGLPYTYDLGELGRYYKAYESLMAHWRAVLPPGVMLEIRYEDLVADLEGHARRIVSHCGLEWDRRCLDFHQVERWVHTASAVQVRQPIYGTSVGRWKAYEPHLEPLLEALGA